MNIDWNEEAAALFDNGIRVPVDGSETDAVISVTRQLREAGVSPSQYEVLRLVRNARKKND